MLISHIRRAIVIWAVLPIALLACAYFLFKVAAPDYVVKAQSNYLAFTFEGQIFFYSSDPTGQLNMTRMVARRSDGTRVSVNLPAAGRGMGDRTLFFTDGSRTDVIDALKAKTTWPPQTKDAAMFYVKRYLDPPDNCAFPGENLLAENISVLGHSTAELSHNAVGGLRMTMWRAPDLGCTTLKSRVDQREADGSYKLMSLMKPVSLKIGAPDTSLFNDGSDYTEMRPSDMHGRVRALLGYNGEDPADETYAKMDALYEHDWAVNPNWVGR